MKRLAAISAKLASVKSNRDHELRKLLSEVVLAPTFQLPLSPYMVCAGLNIEKCRVLGSAKAPLWLEFTNAVAGAAPHVVIFKTGDDLRQDQLALQLLRSMDALWRARGLDLRMSPYGCVATARNQGFIEVVPQSATLSEIRTSGFATALSIGAEHGAPFCWPRRQESLIDLRTGETRRGEGGLLRFRRSAQVVDPRARQLRCKLRAAGVIRHAGLAPASDAAAAAQVAHRAEGRS